MQIFSGVWTFFSLFSGLKTVILQKMSLKNVNWKRKASFSNVCRFLNKNLIHSVFLFIFSCPGSVMFLFELSNNQRILHVGDFRADVSMLGYASLTSKRLNVIYLDTTYCNPRYCFPPQHQTTNLVKVIVEQFLEKNPRTLIVVGTYTIGKERVFRAIGDSLSLDKIAVSKNKLRVLKCLEDPLLSSKLTLDYNAAQLHILPMMHVTVAVC